MVSCNSLRVWEQTSHYLQGRLGSLCWDPGLGLFELYAEVRPLPSSGFFCNEIPNSLLIEPGGLNFSSGSRRQCDKVSSRSFQAIEHRRERSNKRNTPMQSSPPKHFLPRGQNHRHALHRLSRTLLQKAKGTKLCFPSEPSRLPR